MMSRAASVVCNRLFARASSRVSRDLGLFGGEPLSPVVVGPPWAAEVGGRWCPGWVGWLVVFFVVVCPAAPVLVGDRFPSIATHPLSGLPGQAP